nr:hypothetical protein GCM10020092_020230 [Actinoplanes digitatis]
MQSSMTTPIEMSTIFSAEDFFFGATGVPYIGAPLPGGGYAPWSAGGGYPGWPGGG